MKLLKKIFVFLLCFGICSAASGEEVFHSEFGFLPPQIPQDSGLTAGELNKLVSRIDDTSLPPSHRLRRAYEWIMGQYQYDPDAICPGDLQDPETASVCLIGMIQNSASGNDGFALLAHYLLDRMEFPSVIISGELETPEGELKAHQWNYVFYSGKWYHFDPLGEMINPELNGFMNVQKELTGGPLHWDASGIPDSAQYPVKAIGCSCDF